jgi:hypothetical protein
LLALGLKEETADMSISTQSFDTDNGIKYSLIPYSECKYRIMYNIIPAWSLHRLIVLSGMGIVETTTDNIYDKVIQYIEFLIKCEDFNKEYLEE